MLKNIKIYYKKIFYKLDKIFIKIKFEYNIYILKT